MVNRKPMVELDGLYNQKQTAELLGVERHTVKRYERGGFLTFHVRLAGKSKVTSGRDVIRCWESLHTKI